MYVVNTYLTYLGMSSQPKSHIIIPSGSCIASIETRAGQTNKYPPSILSQPHIKYTSSALLQHNATFIPQKKGLILGE